MFLPGVGILLDHLGLSTEFLPRAIFLQAYLVDEGSNGFALRAPSCRAFEDCYSISHRGLDVGIAILEFLHSEKLFKLAGTALSKRRNMFKVQDVY